VQLLWHTTILHRVQTSATKQSNNLAQQRHFLEMRTESEEKRLDTLSRIQFGAIPISSHAIQLFAHPPATNCYSFALTMFTYVGSIDSSHFSASSIWEASEHIQITLDNIQPGTFDRCIEKKGRNSVGLTNKRNGSWEQRFHVSRATHAWKFSKSSN
jgi:hypothetical protein